MKPGEGWQLGWEWAADGWRKGRWWMGTVLYGGLVESSYAQMVAAEAGVQGWGGSGGGGGR